ncbi:MAG: FAD-binding oxidoreductase [Cycloclasticus sp.]
MMITSWNRYPLVSHTNVLDAVHRHESLPITSGPLLAFGSGRSYGDVCLNEGGVLLRTRRMDRFIAFDESTGVLVCESGVLLADILDLVVPQGWFLPVTPGTRFVTVGGAIANDVHGKNHHIQGNFGHHVRKFELLRSDGERKLCCPDKNIDWFRATIGGLGLTGLITWVELQLLPIINPFMITESKRFHSLDDFWELSAEAESQWPYTVAWIDCTATGKRQGRGILMLGQHAPAQADLPTWKERPRRFPVDPPFSLVNTLSVRAFNLLYYNKPIKKGLALTHYKPYFYPLDGMLEWNRMYGRKGFFQYQCVLPPEASQEGIRDLLNIIANSGSGSFLAVLKTFGSKISQGMLSFPRPGATLALDFPNQGKRTLRLLNELDAVVREAGGALYPAKDARMPSELFRSAYPLWEQFSTFIDPQFSSSFWRRVKE